MEDKNEDLGEFFRTKFEGHRSPLEIDEWEKLNTKLQIRNFLRFNVFRFNVYYAVMIIIIFIVAAINISIDTNISGKTPENDTIGLNRSDLSKEKVNVVRNQSKSSGTDNKLSSHSSFSSNIVASKRLKAIKDTIKSEDNIVKLSNEGAKNNLHEQPSSHLIQQEMKTDSVKSSPKTKHVHYITKQDTIIQYDTVAAPKKKKNWFFSK